MKIDKELEKLYRQKKEIEREIELLEAKKQREFKSFISLKDQIYINTSQISTALLKELKNLAVFDNPQVKILKALRKPLYNTPLSIKSFEHTDNILKLPRGLMRGVIELFKRNNLNSTFYDNRLLIEKSFPLLRYTLRDEQNSAIEEITKKDYGLCVAPPGFGKTLIGAKMIELRGVNTLVIVNKNLLLDQWRERFVDYFGYSKKDIGYLGKSKNTLNNTLDIATMQSLKNNIEIIKNYSFVIVDEAHHIPALTFEKIIKEFMGKYILGLSATPNRKDGLEPLIFQQLGSIVFEQKAKRQQKNSFEVIETPFVSNVDSFTELIAQIINDETRNQIIINQVLRYEKRKILILTDRIEHIDNLELLLKFHKKEYVAIHGSQDKKLQQQNMDKVQNSNLVLATTSFFGEGIDFPHLDTIIFATPISYYGRVVQYLGRIGRGGSDCLALDILDVHNKFALSSFKKRKEGYKQLHYIRINS